MNTPTILALGLVSSRSTVQTVLIIKVSAVVLVCCTDWTV